MFTPKVKIGAIITFDTGVSVEFNEGDTLNNVVYNDGSVEKTVSGIARVLNISTRAYSDGPTTCPPDSFINDIALLNEIILDVSTNYDADLIKIPVNKLVSIESVTPKV